jgi:hypothetical protein
MIAKPNPTEAAVLVEQLCPVPFVQRGRRVRVVD